MKHKVLFVDDEPNILSGLKRMLRSMRDQWDMEFASSGTEALAILEKWPFDVIVTDMQMPGMNGSELLAKIRDKAPDIIRIILSGQTDSEIRITGRSFGKLLPVETRRSGNVKAYDYAIGSNSKPAQRRPPEGHYLPYRPPTVYAEGLQPAYPRNKSGRAKFG